MSGATSPRVLLVDDEPNFRSVLGHELASLGHAIATADHGEHALARLAAEPFEVVLLDLRMPVMGGLEVLRRARRLPHPPRFIVLTGHGSIDSVVEAMKLGAFDYLTKPCRLGDLDVLIRRAAGLGSLAGPAASELELVGRSPALWRTVDIIDRAAPTHVPVLIEGESGTGKELLARRLHARSSVAAGPLVVVNCGTLADTLLVSELFGHERGAFTGADRRKHGLLEQADGGTAFLDEIGELSLDAQVRLLRFIQFGELRRLGSVEELTVKARIVAATNTSLLADERGERFRRDLFYRLNTIHVRVPPLRERAEDIPLLIARFLAAFASPDRPRTIDEDAIGLLAAYPWPGNVRELENIVARLAILARGDRITKQDVLEHFEGLALTRASSGGAGGGLTAGAPAARTLRDIERAEIAAALHRREGNKTLAARDLGIALKTLYNKIKAYDLPG